MAEASEPVSIRAGDIRFADLRDIVKAAGLFATRRDYYLWKIPLNLLLFAIGWMAFILVGDSWWNLAVAGYLALAYTQTGLLGHDIAHHQVTRNKRTLAVLSVIHGGLIGISYGWWTLNHNEHHNHPNHVDKDPDVYRRLVAMSPVQAEHTMGGFHRFVVRHQATLFFPLLVLYSVAVRTESIKSIRAQAFRNYRAEGLILAVHGVVYFAAVFAELSPLRAVVFVLLHQALFGLYLGAILAPNHKGEATRDGDEEELDWVTRQVITSRNLVPNAVTHFFFGGLNYQIEHHLFPTMSRPNLRRCRPLVKEYCARHGLEYGEVTTLESYRIVLRHLADTGAEIERVWSAA